MRALLYIGLIVSTCLFFAGCGDERNLLYPYRGADYFAETDDGELKDTVLAFRIGTVRDVLQGHHALVPVTKIAGKERIYYLDFTIGYDSYPLAFMGATRGPLYDRPGDFEWEYFTYRYGPLPGCDSRCSTGQIKFVCMADQNDGPHQPLEYGIPDGTTLFTLDFLVSNDRTLECQFIPISFFWIDCSDNQVVYQDDTLETYDPYQFGISRYVWDAFKRRVEFDNPFSSYTGANSACDSTDEQHPVKRYVDFWSGGIDIICADSIDTFGDINLNGLAYEIGDAIAFSNYFVVGPVGAFTINIDRQTATTDINGNGIPLELADFVYLVRIIVGDAIPAPSPIYEPLFVAVDSNIISISAPHPIGALHVVLEGDIAVTLTSNSQDLAIKSGYVNSQTRLLLYSFGRNVIPNGEILQADSEIRLVDIQAASYHGAAFKNIIIGKPEDILKGDSLTVVANPNPFLDSTIIAFTPSDSSGWRLQIYATSGLKVWEFDSPAGSYISHTVWKPKNLPAGVYYAHITTSSKSGRLTLIYKL